MEELSIAIENDFDVRYHAALRDGLSPLLLAMNGHVCGIASLGDQIRPKQTGVLNRLRRKGWQLAILSGDHPKVVERIEKN